MYTGNDNTLSQVMYQVINNTGNHTIAAVKAEESYLPWHKTLQR